jgi:peptidoglycan/xylan/chitin deacetylase (PgdA/CDA1 family)
MNHWKHLGGLIILTFFLGACAGLEPRREPAPPVIQDRTLQDFVAVITREGDTYSSLAARYLSDPQLDWLISDFNDGETLASGQGIIVPRKSFGLGGLSLQGYQTVPILSYHQFSTTESNKMTLTKSAFQEQMRFLKENGYRVITLDQLFDFLDFKAAIPQKSVVITIDDGWRSTYEIAYPILKAQGFPATLFVYTDLLTGSEKTLSWDLVKDLSENGIDIQCHTKSHSDLTLIEKKDSFKDYFNRVEEEITACNNAIKKRLNRPIRYLAYPYGTTNQLVIAVLKKHGYRGAMTVKRGGNPFFVQNFRVNRSMIYGDTPLDRFKKNLAVFQEEVLQ